MLHAQGLREEPKSYGGAVLSLRTVPALFSTNEPIETPKKGEMRPTQQILLVALLGFLPPRTLWLCTLKHI